VIIAHRGNSSECPESTLAAFRSALEIGVDMIEFDVWWTADRGLAVMHDATVDRCTDGSGEIERMTLAQLRRLDAGSWKHPHFAGERVPTLSEALAVIAPPTAVNLHVKTRAEDPAFEQQLYDEIAASSATDRVLVVHDWWTSLERVRDIDQGVELCLLPQSGTWEAYIHEAVQRGLRVLQPGRDMMCAEFCAAVHEHGMTANVFYANSEPDMRQYIAWGVDGILTDCPGRLKAVLEDG
jgi:glycerophosphoryl diester phosphodiesterase